MIQELRKRAPTANVIQLDPEHVRRWISSRRSRGRRRRAQIVVAAFASVAAYRGNTSLSGGFPQVVANLVATKEARGVNLVREPLLVARFFQAWRLI